jgi:transposase
MVLEDIGPAVPDNFYVFTMDNLNAHKNEAVIALIHAYGHGVVYRAPYWAVDAAIEYVFNTLQALLRAKLYRIKNMNDLIAAVYESIQSMIDFSNYFRNVGFIND